MSLRFIGSMLSVEVGKLKIAWNASPKGQPVLSRVGTPLERLRVGSVVDTSGLMADFVLAEANGSFVKDPGMQLTCCAYGCVLNVNGSFTIHRFYLRGIEADQSRVLQVMTQGGVGVVEGETKLLQSLTEIVPETPEDWAMWLEEHVEGGDMKPPLIGGDKLNWGDISYDRTLGGSARSIKPINYHESVYHDPVARPRVEDSQSMQYHRAIGGEYEFLYLSAVHTDSEAWVEAHVGIAIDPNRLIVI